MEQYFASTYATSCEHNWLADDAEISFSPSGGTRRQDATYR
jgi:hypothetical protein